MSLPHESSAETLTQERGIAPGSLLAVLIGQSLLHLHPQITAVWLRRPVIGCIYTTTTSTIICIIFDRWTDHQIGNLHDTLALRQKADLTVITDSLQHHQHHGVAEPPTTPPPRRGRRGGLEFMSTDKSDDSLEKAVAAEARHLEAFTFPTSRHTMPASPSDTLAPLQSPTSPTKRDSPLKLPIHSSQSPAKSMASSSRHHKRLSLNLPVQPLIIPPQTAQWYPGSPLHSPTHEYLASPTAETPFLAKLAAQERRVLELRDELKQAEKQLETLKRQWALEEAQKKRADVRKVHQLRPLSATLLPALDALNEDEDGSSEWMTQEMERRKQLMSRSRPTNRKVFSGSRHMRTLSLLSPERGHFRESSLAERPEAQREEEDDSHPMQRPAPRYEASSRSHHTTDDQYLAEIGQSSKEDIIKTSKQMAVDIKEGFFTFIEDLRQATVGEEGITGTEARVTQSGRKGQPSDTTTTKRSPKNREGRVSSISPSERAKNNDAGKSVKSRPKSWWTPPSDPLLDIASSFWRDHGVEATPDRIKTRKTPSPATRKRPVETDLGPTKPVLATPLSEASEGWAWDTPNGLSETTDTPVPMRSRDTNNGSPTSSQSSEELDTQPGASPCLSTDRTLTPRSSIDTNDASPTSLEDVCMQMGSQVRSDSMISETAIPWPVLRKLSPSNLRRTASHLMAEWERGLMDHGDEVPTVKLTDT